MNLDQLMTGVATHISSSSSRLHHWLGVAMRPPLSLLGNLLGTTSCGRERLRNKVTASTSEGVSTPSSSIVQLKAGAARCWQVEPGRRPPCRHAFAQTPLQEGEDKHFSDIFTVCSFNEGSAKLARSLPLLRSLCTCAQEVADYKFAGFVKMGIVSGEERERRADVRAAILSAVPPPEVR